MIDEAIRIAVEDRKHRYGSPRLHIHLNESGFPVALNTVAESMRRQNLVAKSGLKFKATTNSAHNLPVSPNLLEQDFTWQKINEKWAGDITYLWTDEGWLYLAVVLDLYSRRVHRLVDESPHDERVGMRLLCRWLLMSVLVLLE